MEWETAKVIMGTASTAFVGAQAMLKVYQRLRIMLRTPQPAQGVTIFNGEAKQLFEAIGRIEKRQDHHGRQLETVVQRVSNLEQRLST